MKYPYIAISMHKTGECVVMTGKEKGRALAVNLSDFSSNDSPSNEGSPQSRAYLALLRAVTSDVNPNWIIDLRFRKGITS